MEGQEDLINNNNISSFYVVFLSTIAFCLEIGILENYNIPNQPKINYISIAFEGIVDITEGQEFPKTKCLINNCGPVFIASDEGDFCIYFGEEDKLCKNCKFNLKILNFKLEHMLFRKKIPFKPCCDNLI